MGAQVLGHQVRPLLMVLPLGILGSAVLCDLAALMSGERFFGQVGYFDVAAGLLVGLVALAGLLIDLVTAPPGSTTRRAVGIASGAVAAMVAAFGVVWSVRAERGLVGSGWLFALEVVALAVGITGVCYARRREAPPPPPAPVVVRRTVPLRDMAAWQAGRRYGAGVTPGRDWLRGAPLASATATSSSTVSSVVSSVVSPAGAHAARAAHAASSASLRESPSRPS